MKREGGGGEGGNVKKKNTKTKVVYFDINNPQ